MGYDVVWIAYDNTANVPYLMTQGINQHTKLKALFAEQEHEVYINYPSMKRVKTYQDIMEVVEAVKSAGVVILNESTGAKVPYYGHSFLPYLAGKKVIRYGHGTFVRHSHEWIKSWTESHRVFNVVTTPDLLDLLKPASLRCWIPAPIDTANPLFTPIEKEGEKFLISHSPTNPEIKGTAFIKDAIKVLQRKYPNQIELVLTEKMSHHDCITLRKKCNAHVDQLKLGASGVSALEGLLLKQFVLVYLTQTVENMYSKKFDCPCPFINTNTERIRYDIEKVQGHLFDDWLLHYGREWVLQTHNIKRMVDELMWVIDHTPEFKLLDSDRKYLEVEK